MERRVAKPDPGIGAPSVRCSFSFLARKQGAGELGQALVEFVIILIFIMAMCAGMIASIRLLTFQYWAQQEARYLAFEQTWASQEFYGDGVADPIAKLNDGGFFGRPQIVSDRTANKAVSDDGGLRDLLSWLPLFGVNEPGPAPPIGELDRSPVMLASKRDSIWTRKTSEWFEPGGLQDRLSSVSPAFASQSVQRRVRSEGFDPRTPTLPSDYEPGVSFPERLGERLRVFFQTAKVGPAVCDAWVEKAGGEISPVSHILEGDCADTIERGLGQEIANNVDIREFVRGYEDNVRSGFTPTSALETSVREEVATGFYSLFDTLVTAGRQAAVPLLLAGRAESVVSLTSSKVTALATEFRYIGSNIAIAQIIGSGFLAGAANPFGSVQDTLDLEQSITGILHEPATDAFFFLSPTFFPVPPTFGSAGGGIQNAIMRNLLSQSEDSELRDEQIDNSNKMVVVTYNSAGGMFRLATNEIRGAETAALSARFYLVTQPWHLTRRQDGTGPYREKGTQFDTAGDETEEAVMRRRVLGLWLIPSDVGAFLEPISAIPGLGFLSTISSALGPIGSFVGIIKRFVTDNPLFDIARALSEIPVIGDIIPVPPVWPAVRPDAYPGSTEMTGNDPDAPDMLMNENRNFSDYVTEQRKNDPDPNPDFGDSE